MYNNLHITDDLLVKYMLGEAMPEEVQAVVEWLQRSTENEKHFTQLQTIWDSSKLLANTLPIDENEAWIRFKQMTLTSKQTKLGKVKNINLFRKQLSYVAAIAAVLLGIWLIIKISTGINTVSLVQIETKTNTKIDTLADGSIITLNKNTALTYPKTFNQKTRTVSLKGEAFFKVAPDKSKPFIIQANDVTVTVVGTEFNIKSYGVSTEIIVESGLVRVEKNNELIELYKGEKLLVTAGSKLEKKPIVDSFYNFYRTRKIVCNSTPLPQLLQWLHEAYGVDIIIGDSSLNSLQINTVFDNEKEDNIIAIIEQTFNLKATLKNNEIVLYPAATK